MNKFVIGGLIVFLLAGIAATAAYWPFRGPPMLRLPGIVEIQEVRLGSKVGGRIAEILVKEGEIVTPQKRLVVFEAPELENQKHQLLAKLAAAEAEWLRAINGARPEEKDAARAAARAAQARYERAHHGPRPEEKEQARSDLDTAEADHAQALKEWTRILPLYQKQAISRAEYEAALAGRDRAKGRLESARARMIMTKASRQEDVDEARAEWARMKVQQEMLDNGTRWEDIAIAKAKVDELRANLEAVEINLKETIVLVPSNFGHAVVEVLAIRPGDIVPANQPVVRVLRVDDLWVKIFVPETKYGLVTLGKEVEVTIDSHPGKRFKGKVVQRANISEFTPRNVQSVDERRHQVFGVKVLVEDPQGVFNAGMAAEVAIPLDES